MENDYFVPQGWQCPVCKRVYSPSYPWCLFCGGNQTSTATTGTFRVGVDVPFGRDEPKEQGVPTDTPVD